MPANIDIFINGKDMTGAAVTSAKSGLASLGTSVDATSGKFSAMSVAVGTVIGNMVTAGISKLGQLASSIVATGVNFDNMRQQAQIAFTTMLGDGGRAKVFLDDLQKFAASTPFEFPELVSASQKLLAMGFAAEDVKPTLTAVGDAVAGLGGGGEMIGRVTTALGQMQAKGKVSSEEMMQLTEAGIPVWDMLAKKIGVSVPEAMDMVSGKSKSTAKDSGTAWTVMADGVIQVLPKMEKVAGGIEKAGVSAADAIGAITEGMKERFGGLMEAQSKTFGGLWSTIKDTFTQVSGQVMQPFFDKMTEGLQVIVDWTSSPQFTGGVESLTRWLQTAADTASVFFGDLMAGQTVVEALTHVLRILLPPELFNIWERFRGAVNEVFDIFAGRISVMDVFQRYWDNTWQLVNQAIDFALTYVTQNLPIWQSTLLGWAQAAWQWIVDATPTVIEKLKEWGSTLVGWLASAWPTLAKTLLQWGTALYTWIGDVIPKAIDSLSDFVRGLRKKGEGEGGSQLSQMVSGWASTLWRWIREDVIPEVGPAFSDFIRATLEYGSRMLTSLGGLASELGQTLWQWIVEITPVAVKKLGEWGGALWDWLRAKAPVWKDKLVEWGTIAWTWIRDIAIPEASKKLGEWGSLLWNWIKEKAPVWRDKLAEWANLAWTWIRDIAIPEAVKKLGEWGTAMWGWVQDNAPAWRDKLGEWATAAWEWITLTAIPEALIKLGEWGATLIGWVKENAPIWGKNLMEAGENMMVWLRDGLEIGWIRVTDWFFSDTVFGGFVGDMLSMLGIQLGPAYGVMYENGKKITYSLNDGSRYGLDALRQTGSDMGSALSGGLKTNLDMHSPSRVMWGYGEDVLAGLTGGIRANLAGLRSEMQFVADTIKATMDRANADVLASVEYFTNQALIKAQTAQTKLTNAAVDASKILKQLGIDPSKAVGLGPNGELILPGVTNLPKSTNKPVVTTGGTGDVSEVPNYTSLSEALGIIKNAGPVIASSAQLLGGLTLTQQDLDPLGTRNKGIIGQAVGGAFDSLKALLGGNDTIAALGGQSGAVIESVTKTLTNIGDVMQRIGETASTIQDAESFRDTMNAFASRIVSTLWEGKKDNALSGNTTVQEWLTSVVTKADESIKASLATGLAALRVKDPLGDFVAGMGDFLKETLAGANQVFGYFKYKEEDAFKSGTLQEFMGSETAQTKTQLTGLYKGLQNSIADILGISPSELNVTGANSLRLADRIKQLTSGTNAETNMEFIGKLLQSAVDFRNLSNFGTGANYYASILPTDQRLTGSPTSNTTQYNITLQGSNNANADVMGLVQLLSSLQGTATA